MNYLLRFNQIEKDGDCFFDYLDQSNNVKRCVMEVIFY